MIGQFWLSRNYPQAALDDLTPQETTKQRHSKRMQMDMVFPVPVRSLVTDEASRKIAWEDYFGRGGLS